MRFPTPLFALASTAALLATPTRSTYAQRASTADARVAAQVRGDVAWAHLRFLADDMLEGRGTGARGAELAAHYLAAQFMALGLEPAGDGGTFFHQVPIVSLNPAATLEVTSSAPARALRYRDDFVAWAERPESVVTATGELVFVGFGIAAPEWNWDDYQGVDLRGKVLVMLVNDPGLRNPDIFRGRILTYYGRWTYKLEEAARRGATGVLLVHNDTMATYGWNTVVNSWTGDQVRLADSPAALLFGAWIRQPVLAELLAARGHDLGRLMAQAAQRGFRPVATGIEVRVSVRSTVRRTSTANVVGRLPGSDPTLASEAVLITAHYDHLGIGAPVGGDSIMNGAVDNASGVAGILAVAEAFARSGVRPRRSLLFVGFAAEEKGLLGSESFAGRPPVAPALLAAVLNLDGANLYGATRDIAALGTDQSSLGRAFAQAARAERLRVTVDSAALLRGAFFRSDHFPLAKIGVPGLSWQGGNDFVGKPAGWGQEQEDTYNRERYHQPDDELLPWYSPDGLVQQARVLARVAVLVGNATSQPTWSPTSEFRAAGERRSGGR
jgi:Zn-dependent M28 family amino/carboxypeptidase